mmetsp:Transcript_15344/g.17808  ORF Transcript_15344/g.17808 Transcript_15344/m.17808 type:complete len:129 (+) Transcript_15344:28-414(+)
MEKYQEQACKHFKNAEKFTGRKLKCLVDSMKQSHMICKNKASKEEETPVKSFTPEELKPQHVLKYLTLINMSRSMMNELKKTLRKEHQIGRVQILRLHRRSPILRQSQGQGQARTRHLRNHVRNLVRR